MARLNCECGQELTGIALPQVCISCGKVMHDPKLRRTSFATTLKELAQGPHVLGVIGAARTAAEQMVQSQWAEADPHGIAPHAPGAKLDAGKMLPWLCIAGFSRALAKVAEVTTKGAPKYSPNGWMEVPDGQTRYMDAFARHMLVLGRGETVDVDTEIGRASCRERVCQYV